VTRRPLALAAAVLLTVVACSSDGDSAVDHTAAAAASAPAEAVTSAPPAAVSTTTPAGRDTDPPDPGSMRVDTGTSEPAPAREPLTIDELLALGRPIVLAHAGGEDVHPHSTPYAYAESVAAGVDMLDFDVRLTADGVLVVHHDDTVDRTTNGTGAVGDMTFGELRALDDAYWFTRDCVCRGRPESEYVHRGVRTGERTAPKGYDDADFAIARLRDIVTRFPSMPLNIEIKSTGHHALEAARVLAAELAELGRLEHAVVTSFEDAVNDEFRRLAPGAEVSPGVGAASAWVLGRAPLPDGMRILQLPPEFQGVDVLSPEVIAESKAAGYPIWVWPNDRALENAAGYARFLAMGLDGLNANDPAVAVAAVRAFAGTGTGGIEDDAPDLAPAAAGSPAPVLPT
jgi:glycerophosphoryl diester phosphodiesterase